MGRSTKASSRGGNESEVFVTLGCGRFYNMTNRASESPHCWSLASAAYQQAFQPKSATHKYDNQALVITGESGAGKTFTTKQVLDYLAWVGSNKGQDKRLSSLTDKMLTTTPILEG